MIMTGLRNQLDREDASPSVVSPSSPPRQLSTERLSLKTVTLDDAEEIYQIRSLESVYKWFGSSKWNSIDDARTWIKEVTATSEGYTFSVRLKATRSIIGVVGLNRASHLMYMFHPDFWGAGYCTEALLDFIHHWFSANHDQDKLGAWAMESNMASRNVLSKCGFISFPSYVTTEKRTLEADEDAALRDSIADMFSQSPLTLDKTDDSETTKRPKYIYYEYQHPRLLEAANP